MQNKCYRKNDIIQMTSHHEKCTILHTIYESRYEIRKKIIELKYKFYHCTTKSLYYCLNNINN